MSQQSKEWTRLMAYYNASRHRPTMSRQITGRRFVKMQGTGTGQRFLKNARIVADCPIEKVFIVRK